MQTMDLYLAGFLMANGHAIRVVKLILPSGRVACEFHFPPEAESAARTFDAGVMISAPVLTDAIKRLKLLIAKTPLLVTQPIGAGR
jgi:hypothetical protein